MRTTSSAAAEEALAARLLLSHGAAPWRLLVLGLPFVFLAALYVYPLLNLLRQSLWSPEFTLDHYIKLFGTPVHLRVLGRTFQLAFFTSCLCLLIAYPIAYFMVLARPRIRALIVAIVILPFWTSALVRALAWIALLGRGGVVNTWLVKWGLLETPAQLVFNTTGVYVGTVHYMLPYMIFCLFSAMQGIDRNLLRAAQTLGGSPFRVFLRVFLPLSIPGVTAGFLLVFILSLGFFITPAVLGGLGDITFVMLIEKQMNELLDWPLASASAALLLAVTFALYWGLAGFFGFSTMGMRSETTESRPGAAIALERLVNVTDQVLSRGRRGLRTLARALRRVSPGSHDTTRPGPAGPGDATPLAPARVAARLGGRAVAAFAWTTVVVMVLPIALITVLAFGESYDLEFPPRSYSLRWFAKYFSRADWTSATVTSFQVAVLAAVIATVLGILAALGLRRMWPRLRTLAFAFMLSPLVIPAIVYAVGIYLVFAKLGLAGTKIGISLAHAVLVFPLALVVIFGALQGLDRSLDRAAASLGASPWQSFRHVTLALIRPAVVTGLLLTFLTSFDEVVVALFLSGANATTLPRKLYESIRFDTDPTMVAASVVLIGLTLVVFVGAGMFRVPKSPGSARDGEPGNAR